MALPPFIPSFAVEGYPPPNPAKPAKVGADVEHHVTPPPAKPAKPAKPEGGLPPFIPSFKVEGYPTPKASNPPNHTGTLDGLGSLDVRPTPAKSVNSPSSGVTLDGLGGLDGGGTNSVNSENDTRPNPSLTRDPAFDGFFPGFDQVAAALLKQESPEEKAYNDRLARADGWNPPMVPVPFFPDPPIAPPTTPTVGKVLPLITKPVVARAVVDPDLDFVRSALTANIFAASHARGLTFRIDADGDLVIQGKGLTENDAIQFEPHEAAIVEALNP
jgi:hypothetical protein